MLKKTTSNFNNIWETQGKNLSDTEITGLQINRKVRKLEARAKVSVTVECEVLSGPVGALGLGHSSLI